MQMNLAQKIALINADFDIWSGTAKLEDPDINIGDGGSLPSKEVADLGRKWLIDKCHLKPFHKLKGRSRSLILKWGMCFIGGTFAIPVDRIQQISSELDEIAAEFEEEKQKFIANYDIWVQEWRLKNPDFAESIAAGALPVATVSNRLGFNFQIFNISGATPLEAQKVEKMMIGLGEKLMLEIVEGATMFFHENLAGKDAIQYKSRKTLQHLRNKVAGLAFLDGRFNAIVWLLDSALAQYTGGKVVGEAFYKISSTILILSSKEKTEEWLAACDNTPRPAIVTPRPQLSLLEDEVEQSATPIEAELLQVEQPKLIDVELDTVEIDIDNFFKRKVAGASFF